MSNTLKVLIIATCVAFACLMLHRVTSVPWQITIGFGLGVFLSSMHESIVHQYLGHAKAKTREFWKRHPRVFLPLIEGFFLHHVVHHGKTFREGYMEQFGGSLDSQSVDSWAPEAFYRLFAPADQEYVRRVLPPHKVVEHLHAADYGLGAVSAVKFASTVFPLVLIVFAVAPFSMALSAALPMLFIYPAMSNSIHRQIMHVPQDGGVKVARNDSSLGWFIGSAYMRAVERWHWMHHEYIYCNYNLLVLADFFRGARRKPSEKDLEKMASEGLTMYSWSWFRRPRKIIT